MFLQWLKSHLLIWVYIIDQWIEVSDIYDMHRKKKFIGLTKGDSE